LLRRVTKVEAEKFCALFGALAHDKALHAAREAQRKRNRRLAKFYEHVARRIALDAEKNEKAP
jgi:transcription elongation GreA/GreB family factor